MKGDPEGPECPCPHHHPDFCRSQQESRTSRSHHPTRPPPPSCSLGPSKLVVLIMIVSHRIVLTVVSNDPSFLQTFLTGAEAVQYWRRLGPLPSDMTLGSSCRSSLQCLLFIPNSHCEWEQRTCSCQPYHIQFNSSTCLPASLLGFGCAVDAQCTLKVPNRSVLSHP